MEKAGFVPFSGKASYSTCHRVQLGPDVFVEIEDKAVNSFEQLKMEFALGSRAAVMQPIEQEYGITLSIRGVGNYLAHRGFTPQRPIKAWATERQDKIELFHLPSYSPELNPEERLNAVLKHTIGTKVPVRTKAKLKIAATGHRVKLEQSPERAKSFFQDPRVKYAA